VGGLLDQIQDFLAERLIGPMRQEVSVKLKITENKLGTHWGQAAELSSDIFGYVVVVVDRFTALARRKGSLLRLA
jgi:hypothetical protein